jgi:hypothetical protein
MLPLYATRIEDLGPGDIVKADCAAGHHVALLTAEGCCGRGDEASWTARSLALSLALSGESDPTALTVSGGSRAQTRFQGGSS